MSVDINKDELTGRMSENLMVLRNKLHLKQSKLAEKIGISRQTLLEIEKGKRTMQRNTFLSLLSVFRADNSTSDLLDHFGIYTSEIRLYLISPENASMD